MISNNGRGMNRRVQAFIEALERQGIAFDIARIKPRLAESLATVRLRFDRVALRFVRDVQLALHEIVPDGKTLVFTITAPIRLATKSAAALEDKVRRSLTPGAARMDLRETINANRIRVRLAKGVSNGPGPSDLYIIPIPIRKFSLMRRNHCFGASPFPPRRQQ
jgi:hypothetical protein